MKLVLALSLVILLKVSRYINAEICNSPLLEGAILSATSEIDKDRGADKARLHGGGAWTAKVSDFIQYLTIELPDQYRITAIATQGRPFSSAFVENYRIEYGDERGSYAAYKDKEGNIMLFKGNNDGSTVQRNSFDSPIIARWIRINPTRWRDRISMRVELYGCKYVAHTLYFDGKSYIVKDLKRYPIVSQTDKISYRFRTNYADGVILYSRGTQGDIFALQLVDNQLMLNIDLGGEGVMTSLSVGSLLDDNLWHDVSVSRNKTEILFTVDRVMIRERIQGDFSSLDLNREIFIGGVPNFNQEGLMVSQNFTGCMENMYVNETNLFEEQQHDYYTYSKIGDIMTVCLYRGTKPIHFRKSNAYLKYNILQDEKLNCSFDFRTFNSDGTLLYNKFITGGFVRLYLEKGLIKIELESKHTPKAPIEPFDYSLNDGKWHSTMLILGNNRIELHIDGKPSITTRKFSMKTSSEFLIGGGVHGTLGFVGCMRSLAVSAIAIIAASAEKDVTSPDDILIDACQMVDRCSPNPCEHGGTCNQNSEEFFCECGSTGYTGAVCHTAKHPLSCDAYRLDNPKSSTVDINIDVDGSGPLEPFPVTCEMPFDSPTTTTLHHKNEHTTEVKGFSKPGSFVQDIIYNAEMEQIVELVNRSYSCSQSLQYDCLNSRLFNTPVAPMDRFEPFSWWVSRNNQKMDYWGGSLPGTRKCSCGLFGTCVDKSKWCNCDADGVKWESDKGELTQKEYLPVRQLRFGDTGSTMDDKKGRYTLGPLICKGDSLFDNVVSFRYEDATIDLPTFDMGHSGDIYFHFKTTAKNGVLVHSRGPIDFIKILLFEEDSIQFQYHAGNGALGAAANVPYKLNDDNWHSVLFERNRKEARLIIDGNIISEAKERSGPVRALHLTSDLVIGATVTYEEGFVGCIRAFMLNGEVVDLLRIAEEQKPYGVSPGCVGKCASNPCLNNGTCLEGYSSYECDCQWTGFKGPICADEIGVSLRSESYIRYDFETTISTLEENIRVAFVTTEKNGMIFGVSSETGEYLNLMMSTSGNLRLVFDFGFERQEIIIQKENFAMGQIHDIKIRREDKGTKLLITVDNYEPMIHTFTIDSKADAQFNKLKSIYIGRNESMGTGDGFTGCISRAQFDDHFPLRRYFQEARRENVWSYPKTLREDFCGIEPITYPPERTETRPPPSLPPGVLEPLQTEVDDSAILGGVLVIIFLALVLMAILIGRYMSRHKGEYRTHEDTGAKDAPDADAAVVQGKTGHGVPKRKEWFI